MAKDPVATAAGNNPILTTLTAAVSGFTLAGPPRRLRSNLMWGLDRLPVRVEMEATRD